MYGSGRAWGITLNPKPFGSRFEVQGFMMKGFCSWRDVGNPRPQTDRFGSSSPALGKESHMSYSLNSSKEGYVGDHI